MKTKALVILLFLFVLSGIGVAETLPDIKGSAVTLPWDDFKQILDKLQQQPASDPPPPIDYALGRGTLSGSLKDGQLELTATYPISVLKKGWIVCPLVGSSAPLAEVKIDGKTAPVTQDGGNISLVLQGPAAHTLTMGFRVTAPMRPGPGAVSLQLPSAAGQVLTLSVGPKLSGVTVDGATVSQPKGGPVSAILTGDNLTVRYTVAAEQTAETQEKLPPKVLVENSTLVSVDEGFIRAIVQLAYEVRHAPVTEFQIEIPKGFEVADCSGASLVGWKLDDATRVLTATIGFEVKGSYSLTIVLERSTKDESFKFSLPGIKAMNVERERGFFAVQTTGGVEVTTSGQVQGLQLVDAKELPSGLRGGATNPIVLSFKYLRHPFATELSVVRHKTQAVLGAAIDTANYVVQVTEDGDCVTRAVYTVRNNRKQFLEVVLPEDEKTSIWSTFVANKPVKPSRTKEGKLLLPLEKSTYSGSDLESFKVELIYYSNLGSNVRWMGGIDILLPKVDLPISQSALTVFAPLRNKYSRLSGSMQELYTQPHSIGLFGAARDKSDSYSMRSLELKEEAPAKMKKAGMDYDRLSVQQAEAEQVFQTRIRAAQQAVDQTGSLPARFSVPEQGTSLQFQELITIGESSTLTLVYGSRKIFHSLSYLIFFLTLVMAWYATTLVPKLKEKGKSRNYFIAGAVGLVALVVLGGKIEFAVYGLFLGFAGRFVRWVIIQIMKQRVSAEGLRNKK